ncbi:secernin-3 isoform X2 [Chrysoperla carnea]|uniref:secernin-3 isoform X2 n=1 Tax=Chrysoperla carnea TaxID=189513 RepID=UPI001D06FA46|nr:secernin-3 isoform X2 [Chrysoperla carnea]
MIARIKCQIDICQVSRQTRRFSYFKKIEGHIIAITKMEAPQSCDTFVVLPPLTKYGVVFGKNSDRPQGEIQEVVYFPATQRDGKIKCTYIEIDSEGPSQAVILSKPGWMWGAEMGANESSVVIGNEAIWTRDTNKEFDPVVKRLLGMDLVRLGLEYGKTAEDACNVIVKLLEKYGQGGPCSQNDPNFGYHNSFLIADPTCAWVLETIGKHWVAKKITGYYNISNSLSITTDFDKHSEGLLEYAKEKCLWDSEGKFDFAAAFCAGSKIGCERYDAGKELLADLTAPKCFNERAMFGLLRDGKSGICRTVSEAFPTQGSQVSTLVAQGPSIHWFTATPDPSHSVYKPFAFTPNVKVSVHTKCPENEPGAKHRLYELHEKATSDAKKSGQVLPLLCSMEKQCVQELNDLVEEIKQNPDKLSELDDLFKDAVETEVKFYR